MTVGSEMLKIVSTNSIRALVPETLVRQGAVHVLDLKPIRSRAAARWEKSRDAVYTRLEQALQRQLGPSDVFLRLDDTSYLISQPSNSADDSDLCCFKIMLDLMTYLFGECAVGDVCLHRVTSCEADGLTIEKIDGVSLHRLAARVSGSGPSASGVSMSILGKPVPASPVRFAPIWDVRKSAITTYRHEAKPAEGLLNVREPRRVFAAFLSSFRRSCEMLSRHSEGTSRFLLDVPVSYGLLSNPIGRMEFVSLCRSLPSHVRQFLQFELDEIPLGIPQSRLSELLSALRPFSRSVVAQLAPGTHDYGAFHSVGLQAIGLSMVPVAGVMPGRGEVESLSVAAHKMRLNSFVIGVDSVELVDFAYAQGIDFMSGQAIGLAVHEPQGMCRLDYSKIAARTALQQVG